MAGCSGGFVGPGTVVSDVQFAYNDFGQVATTYQSHGGAVNTSTSPNVQSTYDTTTTGSVFSAQHRRQTIVYPNGRTVYLDYGTSAAAYDALSKVRTIRDTGSTGTATLSQGRTVNGANEITAISASVGSTWATPAYDAAGNMTTIPQP